MPQLLLITMTLTACQEDMIDNCISEQIELDYNACLKIYRLQLAYGDNEAAFGQSTVNDSLEQHLALQHLGRRGCIKQVLYTK